MERHYRKSFDKTQAAKLYIDSYYRSLVDKTENRQKRQETLLNEIKNLTPEEAKEKELALNQAESESLRLSRHKITVKDFTNVRLIGRGAFGEVRVVRKKPWPGEEGQEKVYAMKIMNKDFMIQKNQLAHARAERDAMVEHDDPGIVKLFFSFQDFRFLYFVMEYLPGGDLMNLLIKRDILSEEETKFYMAEIIEAVQAIHKRGYIHRDLKPDNILIDRDGHLKLSDFGLCTSGAESHLSSFYHSVVPKGFDKEKRMDFALKGELERKSSWKKMRKTVSYSTVGTSNYMAPEILLEKGYGPEVDWWSVGVILYECIVGYAPFSCEDTAETCMMIIEFKQSLEFPEEPKISTLAYDLIKNCLLVDPEKRYTYEQIKAHPWFSGVDFDNIRNVQAPWVPELEDEVDTVNFDEFEDENADFFFGENYTEGFEDLSTKPLKDWDPKHLPFVGWTFTRFEPKEKPSSNSIFQPSEENEEKKDKQEKPKKEKGKIAVWGKKK